jgi:O-6-methylguanine DNA methyltransferase
LANQFRADFRALGPFQATLEAISAPASPATTIHLCCLSSPMGPLLAGAVDQGVCLLEFHGRHNLEGQLATLVRRMDAAFKASTHPLLAQLEKELASYFAGQGKGFSVPLCLPGTPFEEKVWAELRRIPLGATISYAQLADKVGQPTASRAVAGANGRNRVALVVPCHRVVGASGALVGYAGGLPRKQALLELEGSR